MDPTSEQTYSKTSSRAIKERGRGAVRPSAAWQSAAECGQERQSAAKSGRVRLLQHLGQTSQNAWQKNSRERQKSGKKAEWGRSHRRAAEYAREWQLKRGRNSWNAENGEDSTEKQSDGPNIGANILQDFEQSHQRAWPRSSAAECGMAECSRVRQSAAECGQERQSAVRQSAAECSAAECGRVRQSAVTAEAPNSMTVTQLQQKFQCIYLYRKQN